MPVRKYKGTGNIRSVGSCADMWVSCAPAQCAPLRLSLCQVRSRQHTCGHMSALAWTPLMPRQPGPSRTRAGMQAGECHFLQAGSRLKAAAHACEASAPSVGCIQLPRQTAVCRRRACPGCFAWYCPPPLKTTHSHTLAVLRPECLVADVDVSSARFKYEGGSLNGNQCWFTKSW
jgi:hypothetical protein